MLQVNQAVLFQTSGRNVEKVSIDLSCFKVFPYSLAQHAERVSPVQIILSLAQRAQDGVCTTSCVHQKMLLS